MTWAEISAFLNDNAQLIGAAAGLVALATAAWTIIRWMFKRDKPTQLAPETIEQIKQPNDPTPKLTVPEFIRLRRELKEDLEAELAQADQTEKDQLRARIAELERQIANPDEALAEAQKRIKDLEALLDREANDIGADRINEARAALEAGDYSLADDIFADIEAREDLAVQRSARAAYGRGEVAEAEIRWGDASAHYSRAAQLASSFENLNKARWLSWLTGDYGTAQRWGEQLLSWCDENGTQEQYAIALNNHALAVEAQGRFAEAEDLYAQALEIDKATIGEGHPSYAIRLNNLALVVKAQGRFEEAEDLYTQALEIGKATIGEGHPDYATRLNNLAGVVRAQGRFAEAEALYTQALEIGKATIGEGHPDYAMRLGNLGQLLGEQGKVAEARKLMEQGLEIFRNTLPPDHPHIATIQANLDALPETETPPT